MTKKKVGIVGIYEPIRNNCKYQLDETLGEYLDIDVVDMKVVNLDKYDLIVGLDYAEHYFLQELPRKHLNKFILIKTAFDNDIIDKLESIKHKYKRGFTHLNI